MPHHEGNSVSRSDWIPGRSMNIHEPRNELLMRKWWLWLWGIDGCGSGGDSFVSFIGVAGVRRGPGLPSMSIW